MKSGETVICLKSQGPLSVGSRYTVKHSCAAVDRVTLEEVGGTFWTGSFIVDSEENRRAIRAGQWWITRGLFLVLVNHRDGDRLLVSVPCSDQGCRIEVYYSNGRYAESAETEFDLICRAPSGIECRIGIDAPREVSVHWEEVYESNQRQTAGIEPV